MHNNILCSYLLVVVLTACSHVETPSNEAAYDVDGFTQDIKKLSEEVLFSDAGLASRVLMTASTELAKEYGMVSPPRYHNLLVHMGLRDRGLCCHWAEDLLSKLRELPTSSLKFDWLVAWQGVALREHSTVVIYAAGSGWSDGIVFDPWRKAGVPYWAKVAADVYPWQLHPLSGKRVKLRCK
jgi:hypothetical protein